jgi:hypothetical protein
MPLIMAFYGGPAAEHQCQGTGNHNHKKVKADKKNKRIESREICDSDSGSSLEAYIEGIFVSSMEQMVIFGIQERSLIEQIA